MDRHTHDENGDMVLIEPEPVAELTDAAVEIARIEADRDIQLAKINRGLELDLADTDIDVLRAERDLLRDQLAALTAPPVEESEEPIVIIDSDSDLDGEPVIEETLPEPESVIDDSVPPAHKPIGVGMW